MSDTGAGAGLVRLLEALFDQLEEHLDPGFRAGLAGKVVDRSARNEIERLLENDDRAVAWWWFLRPCRVAGI